MNQIQSLKIMVFTVCSLLIIAYLAPFGTFSNDQAEDDWVAHPMYISAFAGSPTPQGYSPAQIRTAYNLNSIGGGAGTTIAIIDAFDTPNILNYFNVFSSQYGLPDNSTGNFLVHKMPGAAAPPPADIDWQLETCLDVEWAHAIAPNAKILLVEAISNSRSNLLSAVDYATSQQGVVAVSMSWGDDEKLGDINFNNHFNKPGISFFAASGDDGSYVNWPAVSAYVVSVGGTTLNLKPNGTVISETAWRNSSGGVSNYMARPSFQTNFGLTYANRGVPDVSCNSDPSTGVSVYNGTWRIIGGTSAGAPQWAAIHALGLSATNVNLYARAKSMYSSYFRDITSGANYVNSAAIGYDLITGLGSPLMFNFGSLTVTPNSGPPGGLITLTGIGFTSDSSVNITYLNPANSIWTPIINNLATTSTQDFTYSFTAPDLLRNNSAGDNQPFSDNIAFRALDNSNGRSYSTTVPYTEWRRGLIQIGNITTTRLFGNNTDFAKSVFVQNGDFVPVSGAWFNPGNVSLQWDGTSDLDTISTDDTGFFNVTIQVATAPAGKHTLTLNDGNSNFCLTLTRLPSVNNDYMGGWHTSNFTINLVPDYAVNETFYRINDGLVFNVTSNGQPAITAESSINKLEYWSTWDLYGTVIADLPHLLLTGIKLDKTAPTGSITPNSESVNTPEIILSLSAIDAVSGVAQMRFSNENNDWSTWEPYATSKTWSLSNGEGTKTINVQYMDKAGLTSTTYSTILNLTTPTPTPDPTTSPTIKPAAIASTSTPTLTPSLSPTNSPTIQPSAAPQIPEVNIEVVFILLAASTLVLALIFKRKRK